MPPHLKISNEKIISALGGVPITDLIEDWSCRIEEVSPYVFRAYGEHLNHKKVSGYGGTAEDALTDCIRKIKKVNLGEQRRINLENTLSKIRNAIKNIFDS